MTSLIDVIFLLLLFFMLTSTFSKFAEVPLPIGGAGHLTADTRPVFIRVNADTLSLNAETIAMDQLATALGAEPVAAIVALGPNVTAQRLTDVLVAVRGLPNLAINVLVPG